MSRIFDNGQFAEFMAADTGYCPKCDGVLERRGRKYRCRSCGATSTATEPVDSMGGTQGHDKNPRPSNWNKHTDPRPGRATTKNRKKKGWFAREHEFEAQLQRELEAEFTLHQGGKSGAARTLPASPWPRLIAQAAARAGSALALLRQGKAAHAQDAIASALPVANQARAELQRRASSETIGNALIDLNDAIDFLTLAARALGNGLTTEASMSLQMAVGSLRGARASVPVQVVPSSRPPNGDSPPSKPKIIRRRPPSGKKNREYELGF